LNKRVNGIFLTILYVTINFNPKYVQKILLPEGLTIFFELHTSVLNNYHTHILSSIYNCKIFLLVVGLLKTDFQFILYLYDKSIYAHL